MPTILSMLILALLSLNTLAAKDIDPSDPTKIYTYMGGGFKYTDYTNDETMSEVRATGNLGISDNDMMMFEFGYGYHDGEISESGLTNARARYFHLFDMDYSVSSGYRGWAIQVDAQIAGELKGTDGQNVVAVGALPAFGISELWSFYLPLNLVNSWDKNFSYYNGLGVSVSPLLVYNPSWWDASYIQFWPNYTYFLSGDLKNQGSGNLDIIMGGAITKTVMWATTFQQNFDIDLNTYRRSHDSGLKNDYNLFVNITTYF